MTEDIDDLREAYRKSLKGLSIGKGQEVDLSDLMIDMAWEKFKKELSENRSPRLHSRGPQHAEA